MPNIFFRKNTGNVLRFTDSVFRYELHHKYFSWTESEIPYDSKLFLMWLNTGVLDVIDIDKDFKYTKTDFSQYLREDEQIKENKIIEEKENRAIKEKRKQEKKKRDKKEQKQREKEIKKKAEEKKSKEKVIVISEEEIKEKLNNPIIKNVSSTTD